MPKRQFNFEGIGNVTIAKRRNNTNMRLSIRHNQQVSLSMPYWTPYIVGVRFVKSREDWIMQQLLKMPSGQLQSGDLIGKNHRLQFVESMDKKIRVRQTATEIIVTSSLPSNNNLVQTKAMAACERALKDQCSNLLFQRAEQLSRSYGLNFSELKFRKLSSRWGSCSSQKVITLNIYLIQLPWHLIDYVISHELAHLAHMDHGQEFWRFLESLLPNAKKLRREIKDYSPVIEPKKVITVA